MVLFGRSKKFARKSALKVVDFALANHEGNCKYFVEILGLKTLFAAFMKKSTKKKGFAELADEGMLHLFTVSWRSISDRCYPKSIWLRQ